MSKSLKNIFADDPEVLKLLEQREQNALLKALVKDKVISELQPGVGKIDVLKGDDGYTPVKGTDYFTPNEIQEFKTEVTPVKGTDYFTPEEIDLFKKDLTPIKGVDYVDGKPGKDADEERILIEVAKLIPSKEDLISEIKIPEVSQETSETLANKLNSQKEIIEPTVIKGGVPTVEDVMEGIKKSKTFQIEKKNIKDFNMSDMRWHGAGLSTISHDSTLTGTGTPSSPLGVVSGALSAAGSDTEIQFNDNGVFGADPGLAYTPNNLNVLAGYDPQNTDPLVTGFHINAKNADDIIVGQIISQHTPGSNDYSGWTFTGLDDIGGLGAQVPIIYLTGYGNVGVEQFLFVGGQGDFTPIDNVFRWPVRIGEWDLATGNNNAELWVRNAGNKFGQGLPQNIVNFLDDAGTSKFVVLNEGYVGISTESPAGLLQIGGADYTVNDPTDGSASINYGVPGYPNDGYTHTYRIYAYKIIPGGRVYSSSYTEGTVTDDGMGGDTYNINVTYLGPGDQDGFRVLFYDDYNGMNYDFYYDTSDESFEDANDLSPNPGSTVTPSSPFGPIMLAKADGTVLFGKSSSSFKYDFDGTVAIDDDLRIGDGVSGLHKLSVGETAKTTSDTFGIPLTFQTNTPIATGPFETNIAFFGSSDSQPTGLVISQMPTVKGSAGLVGTKIGVAPKPIILQGSINAANNADGLVGIAISDDPIARLEIGAGNANWAAIRLNTQTLLSSPVAGAIEPNADKLYYTIPTGTARKEFVFNDSALTAGRIVFTTTNGRLTDNSGFRFNGTQQVFGTGLSEYFYNTVDETTNYERGFASWSGNVFTVGTTRAGSGSYRTMRIAGVNAQLDLKDVSAGATTLMSFGASGNFSTASGTLFDLSGPAAFTQTSGTNYGFALRPTYNQASGSAANTDLLINRTQTAIGSGAQNFIDMQIAAASYFRVSNAGTAIFSNVAAGINLYNTADQVTHFERGALAWASNVLTLSTAAGGTGVQRDVQLKSPIATLTIKGAANSSPAVDYDINAATTATMLMRFGNGTMASASTGIVQSIITSTPSINQSSTAGYNWLFVNVTETATGSGAKNLMRLQVGSVDRFTLDNGGKSYFKGAAGFGYATPGNTTDGDVTVQRLSIGNSTLASSNGLFLAASGTNTDTATASSIGYGFVSTINPASDSSANIRSLSMSSTFNTTANFTGTNSNCQNAGWFENRITAVGTIAELHGVSSFGLWVPTAATAMGTVSRAVGGYFQSVQSFGNALTSTVTNATGVQIANLANSGSGPMTITGQAGLNIEAISGATNNTALLMGTTTVPSGNFAIYNSSTNANYFAGNIGIGTTTFGTSATNTLALFNGTVPSTSPADTVQLFSVDLSAGNATLGIRTETAVVTEAVTSDRTLSVKINGTTYKILLAA